MMTNEQRKDASRLRAGKKNREEPQTEGYLRDEDAGDALRVVSFWVGRPQELLTFSLLKAMQEGWVEDVLQHLLNEEGIKGIFG